MTHPRTPFQRRPRFGFVAPRILRGSIESIEPTTIPAGVAEWTVLTVNDVNRVFQLLQVCEEFDAVPYRSGIEDVTELFEPEIRHAAYGAIGEDGELVAFGIVRVLLEEGRADARCSGVVHPQWRDRRIGSEIVTWQLREGRNLLQGIDAPGGARISRFCDGKADAELDLLERMGFTARYSYIQMRRDLTMEIPKVSLAQHLRLEPWQPEWSQMIREAAEAPEAETADGRKLSENEWGQMHANLVPEWSAVVIDRSTERPRVAGYLMAARWEDEWEALGWSEGYINALSIFGPWRKQGVGTSLLSRAMRLMREDGMEFTGIDIGAESGEDLLLLCDNFGFEPTHSTWLYAVDVV